MGDTPPPQTQSQRSRELRWMGVSVSLGLEPPQEAVGPFWGALTPPLPPPVPRACLRKAVEVASLLAGRRCSVVLQGRDGGHRGGDSGMEGTVG